MDQAAVFDRIMAGLGFHQVPAPLPAVKIDPNIRVRGNQTLAGPGDITGEIVIGQRVMVYEPEAGVSGYGVAASFDEDKQLLFIDVDWASLQVDESGPPLEDVTVVEPEAYDRLIASLDEPPVRNERLAEAARRRRDRLQQEAG